ncbi:N-acetylglucosamine kinase [Spirochaetia bacterium]|nr:N-acetylglucosamine kinase [Spirochaetia bacterium]
MEYVLGLDQGATKTCAVMADLEGNILGHGKTGGSYHAFAGMEHAIARMKAASEAAGLINRGDIAGLGAGVVGVDFPYEYTLVEEALGRAFNCPNRVVNDCIIALRAETSEANSLIICAGTGLNVGLHSPSGEEFVFGYHIDDEWQGGSAIGRRVMRMVFEAEIKMQPATMLTKRVLDFFELGDVETLMDRWFKNQIDKNRLRYLAPAADECAALGDPVAADIHRHFAGGCARYALAGMRNYRMLDSDVKVYLSGGIFKSAAPILREEITTLIRQENPRAQIIDSKYEPVVGALVMGLEKTLDSRPLSQAILQNIYASAEKHGLTRLHDRTRLGSKQTEGVFYEK